MDDQGFLPIPAARAQALAQMAQMWASSMRELVDGFIHGQF
jgi:hypothetical protein